MDSRIKDTLTFIEQNLSQTLNIQDLAESQGLSASRFHHIFRQATGLSVARYIKDSRLLEARRLLENTNLSIKQIRNVIGISAETHFFRDFKQKFGLTPREYRKNHKGDRIGG